MAHLMRFSLAWGLACGLVLFVPDAQALDITVSAEYLGKRTGQFENTTPPALFCRRFSYRCTNNDVVDLPLTYSKEVSTVGPREKFFIQVPGRRQVDVFHEVTGEPYTVSFEFTGVSQRTGGGAWYQNPTYEAIVQGGCTRVATIANPPWVFFLWDINNPTAPTGCHSLSSRNPPDYRGNIDVTDMGISYNLQMPAPFSMKTGLYRGSITYSVGPGGDFDFGDGVTALNTNTVTINLLLDVQHAFFFEFPPGTDRAVLEPRDGWQHWLAGGSVPQRLYKDLPFRLSSSGPFRVYKLCQYDIDARCGLANDKGDRIPVMLSLSLPAGIQHRGGSVERLALPTGRAQALQFEAAQPTLNRPGQMHFEIAKEDVRRMLPNAGSVYAGLATIIFDTEL